jgi:hypothetical protein
MTTKKIIGIACGGIALFAVVVVAALVIFVVYVAKDVEGVSIDVKGPPEVVAVGDNFKLEVVVKNDRPRKVLNLSDVDIAEDYLAGFTVSSIDPPSKSNMHVPIDNKRSFKFDIPISPGSSTNIVFNLRAEKSGVFRGDLDVCEGARFVTGMAQTSVKGKE